MPSDPPLKGIRVIELGGLAPGPFCGLLLSSYGAEVLRIDRPQSASSNDLLTQGKSAISLDLKSESSISILKSLISKADILIDPFRPGILEKLGLDPQSILIDKLNPKLIVVRLTGFRRDGKYKDMAGHDINYLAASGILSLLGTKGNQPPEHPGNVLADFAGGGLVAFTGVLLALINRQSTNRGQIVEANMVDGVSFLGTFPRLLLKTPMWNAPRGQNTLDGGAPYYGCYECKDQGKYVSVGALEPQFFKALLKGLDLNMKDILPKDIPGIKNREDKKAWPYMREVFISKFKTKTRKEWEKIFDGTDACVVPVLELSEMESTGYEQRPLVHLSESPALKVQSPWTGKILKSGKDGGGDSILKNWLGWDRGKDFDDHSNGSLNIVQSKSKL